MGGSSWMRTAPCFATPGRSSHRHRRGNGLEDQRLAVRTDAELHALSEVTGLELSRTPDAALSAWDPAKGAVDTVKMVPK